MIRARTGAGHTALDGPHETRRTVWRNLIAGLRSTSDGGRGSHPYYRSATRKRLARHVPPGDRRTVTIVFACLRLRPSEVTHDSIQRAPAACRRASQDAHRGPRPGRPHRRGAAGGPADTRLRRARLRQDAPLHGVPRARRKGVRRAGRVRLVRGDGRRPRGQLRLARLRPGGARRAEAARARPRAPRAQRGRRGGRVRPRRALRAHRVRGRLDRRDAHRARLGRVAVRRAAQRVRPARRAPPPVPLAQGARPHGDRHRRARRAHAHAPRHRGVRLRLRDRARQPSGGAGLDAPPAHRQVPGLGARRQRVPVPRGRRRHQRAAGHLARPRAQGLPGAHPDRCAAPRHHARRQLLLPRQQHPRLGHRRQRQDEPRGLLRRRDLPP